MGWRIVKQPNGLLARFSEVVDHFTAYDMTEAEALALCTDEYGMSQREAEQKVQAGVEDWRPFTVGVRGDGTERWAEAIAMVEATCGESEAVQLTAHCSRPMDDVLEKKIREETKP